MNISYLMDLLLSKRYFTRYPISVSWEISALQPYFIGWIAAGDAVGAVPVGFHPGGWSAVMIAPQTDP